MNSATSIQDRLKGAKRCVGKAGAVPKLWFIDLDDTLFEASGGMLHAIHLRMNDFISKRLGLDWEAAGRLRTAYWAQYGATFLGLEKHHGIAPKEFFDATHRFDLSEEVPEDFSRAKLRDSLKALNGKRVLVTNGPECYIKALLPLLGIADLFDAVVSADDMRVMGTWRCKPDETLFASLTARFKARPEQCAFIEDSPVNLKTAKKLGMLTVWCAGYRKREPHRVRAHAWADVAVDSLFELARRVRNARSQACLTQERCK